MCQINLKKEPTYLSFFTFVVTYLKFLAIITMSGKAKLRSPKFVEIED